MSLADTSRVEAHKAGHALHTQLVTRLLADPSLWTETYDEAPSVHSQLQPEAAASAAD
jgi:UDP-3-O-acyl-N-acetylglucosamine deacetylase